MATERDLFDKLMEIMKLLESDIVIPFNLHEKVRLLQSIVEDLIGDIDG